jgi:hypothetical protein
VKTAREIVDALFGVLAEERAAIRRLDVAAVTTAAERKEALANALSALGAGDLVPVSKDIPVLRAELRRNGILLVHARACVGEALEILAPKVGGARRGVLRAQV